MAYAIIMTVTVKEIAMRRKRIYPIITVFIILAFACVFMMLLIMAKNREAISPQTTVLATTTEETTEEETTTSVAPSLTQGTTVDTGLMKTVCPAGWLYVEQYDTSGEANADGTYPVDQRTMMFAKGAASADDAANKLTMYVYYNDTALDDSVVEGTKAWYENVEDFDLSLSFIPCSAFNGTTTSEDGSSTYSYSIVFYPIDDSHYIQFSVMTASSDTMDTQTAESSDVQSIMSNLALD